MKDPKYIAPAILEEKKLDIKVLCGGCALPDEWTEPCGENPTGS